MDPAQRQLTFHAGVKMSGIGRELGEEGLAAYSQVKAVHINMGQKL